MFLACQKLQDTLGLTINQNYIFILNGSATCLVNTESQEHKCVVKVHPEEHATLVVSQ